VSVERLPVVQSKARDHFDVTLEQLGQWLAEAETLGGWRALELVENEAGRVHYLVKRVMDRDQRARVWEARLRAELTGLGDAPV